MEKGNRVGISCFTFFMIKNTVYVFIISFLFDHTIHIINSQYKHIQ